MFESNDSNYLKGVSNYSWITFLRINRCSHNYRCGKMQFYSLIKYTWAPQKILLNLQYILKMLLIILIVSLSNDIFWNGLEIFLANISICIHWLPPLVRIPHIAQNNTNEICICIFQLVFLSSSCNLDYSTLAHIRRFLDFSVNRKIKIKSNIHNKLK